METILSMTFIGIFLLYNAKRSHCITMSIDEYSQLKLFISRSIQKKRTFIINISSLKTFCSGIFQNIVIVIWRWYYYYIPDLYSARCMRNTFTCALNRPLYPLPVQIQRDLTRGTDRLREIPQKGERELWYRHVQHLCLALIWIDSLVL